LDPRSKHLLPGSREKGGSENLKGLVTSNIPRKTCQRFNALNVTNMDTTGDIVPSERRMARGNMQYHMSPRKYKSQDNEKKLKKEDPQDLYYDSKITSCFLTYILVA